MKQIRYFLVYDNVLTQVSQGRNTAFGARQGEGKALPRGEGFRVRVTCTYKKRVGLTASGRVTDLIFPLMFSKFDSLRNLSNVLTIY